jgi:Rps23 Pro-64 3,4-dihydroxylase Tpa1-like proline 4-hydroxylase
MFQLNPDIDIDSYKNELKEKKIIRINNIFINESIKDVRTQLEDIPNTWWSEKMNISCKTIYEHCEKINGKIDELNRKLCQIYTKNALFTGHFCYHFKEERNTHFLNCDCVICQIKNKVYSDEFLIFFKNITDNENIYVNEIFASLFENGHYLTIHHDKNKGKYAFIFSFNEDWNPTHGGLLNFYNGNNIYYVSIPSFNTLTIFSLPENEQIDHFVSEVVGNKNRYSFTGWLDDKEKI